MTRRLRAAAIVAPVLAALAATAPAHAEVVRNIYAVTYDATVQWRLEEAFQGVSSSDSVSYNVEGRLPNVTFDDLVLQSPSSVVVKQTKPGTMKLRTDNAQGTSVTCTGGPVTANGMIAVGQIAGSSAFWIAPWLASEGPVTCTDSDGGTGTGEMSVPAPNAANPAATAVPPGGVRLSPSFAQLDSGSWTEEFEKRYTGEECPRYVASSTTSCAWSVQGRIRLRRIGRETRADPNDELLSPAKPTAPPKLDSGRRRAKATVRCPKACDIEALIGAFGMRNGRPHVTPGRSRKVRVKARRTGTVSIALTGAQRAAAGKGTAVMVLRVTIGGKRREATYPLR
ncbi:hypothetical protein AB0L40_08730 [Patulibacter sp. NPDC049589]|uniref:hypothetical protein n=1 Tax=Patulibacter sp. NPDC049589 TaxID=3154731 RepID=UPI0034352EF6